MSLIYVQTVSHYLYSCILVYRDHVNFCQNCNRTSDVLCVFEREILRPICVNLRLAKLDFCIFLRFTKRKERALNAETFGALPRNYRGRPYRGRGGRGGRGRGYGRGGQRGRGRGGNSSRTWVDYEFDFEAAGIRQGSNSNKAGGKNRPS